MEQIALELRVDEALWLFLAARDRHAQRVDGMTRVRYDGTSSLGHVVESFGVPLTEVGALRVDGQSVPAAHRPRDGARVDVEPFARPQRLPMTPPRFVLDVHLGVLARRLRLLGVDTAYRNDAGDDALLRQADDERRALLTQDRGLLRRRRLWFGAYVRGADPDAQLVDVLDRFTPPLAPWTRCLACDGLLAAVPKREVDAELPPGTRRTYDEFARCRSCGRVYWRGAHHRRLSEIVDAALGRPGRPAQPDR